MRQSRHDCARQNGAHRVSDHDVFVASDASCDKSLQSLHALFPALEGNGIAKEVRSNTGSPQPRRQDGHGERRSSHPVDQNRVHIPTP